MQNIYRENLVQIGLSDKEALVYEALIGSPKAGIGQLLHKIPDIKRPNMYALLYALKGKGLVQEVENKGKKVFLAESPQKLVEFTEKREKEYKESKLNLESALPHLLSQFNLASGKPNVQFFEGRAGLEKVLFDSLNSKTEILQYLDNDALDANFADMNERYVKERYRLGIKKRMIAPDTESIHQAIRTEIRPEYTEVRVIDRTKYSFANIMQIYDSKISYEVLTPGKEIGVIIEDPHIYALHRILFEHNWEHAQSIAISTKSSESSIPEVTG